MKSRLPLVLAFAGLAGCGLTSLAINAYADPVASQTTEQSSSDDAPRRISIFPTRIVRPFSMRGSLRFMPASC